jgi:tripartite-type tricarboxylate transporter receptor subunit TctC
MFNYLSRRNALNAALGLATLAMVSLPLVAQAQADYPTKPVKIIVPFPPGGTSDIMGRMIADELSKQLKQPFVVENKGGAGGVIGADLGAKAPADGYTLTLTGVGSNAVAHGLNPKLGYDSTKDYAHISQIHHGPNVLVVHPSRPYKTFQEFVAYARANPGKMNYGLTHAASGHMAMELLKLTARDCPKGTKDCKGLFIVGIPYRGGGPMMNDMLGGQLDAMFINQDTALPQVKAGKLRALAVSSAKRNPQYPDIPTVSEAGFAGFEALSWSGLSAPKGTPAAIIAKLEAAMSASMNSPAVRARMEGVGFVVPPQGAKVYDDFVKAEVVRWSKVIKEADIKAE